MGINADTGGIAPGTGNTIIRAAITVVDPVAQVSVVLPIATTSSVVITYGAYLDSSGRTRFDFEQIFITDALQKNPGKNFTEFVGTTDIEFFSINKGIPQEVFATDNFDRTVSFFRVFPEDVFITDERTAAVGKELSEQVPAVEALAKNIHKFLEDTFTLEDTASAGDGSTFSLAKYINELLEANEALVFSLEKPLTDSLSVVDTPFILFTRPLPDSVSVADDSDILFDKGLTDATSVDDIRVLEAGKNLSESASATGEPVFGVEKGLSESVLGTGEPVFATGKVIANSVSMADLRQWLFSRPLTDSISLSDAVQWTFGKELADSLVGDDAGSLISQGYTENNTYFLEDFVGESRIFT